MYLEHLKYVVEVARLGEISLAAEQLHVSQSNISQAINKLENELGMAIFKRSRSGTKPTESGKAVVLKAQEVIYKVEEMNNVANLNSKNFKGKIYIATIPSVSMSFLPPTISLLAENYPGLDIEIIEEESFKVIEHVKEGVVDLGFVGIPSAMSGNKVYQDIHFFYESEIMACVGENTPFANNSQVHLEEIINYPILSNSMFIIESLKEYGEPKFLFRSKNIEGAKLSISKGLAIGFYTKISLHHDLYAQEKKIVPLTITDKDFKLSIGYLLPTRNKPQAVHYFLEEMMNQVSLFDI